MGNILDDGCCVDLLIHFLSNITYGPVFAKKVDIIHEINIIFPKTGFRILRDTAASSRNRDSGSPFQLIYNGCAVDV